MADSRGTVSKPLVATLARILVFLGGIGAGAFRANRPPAEQFPRYEANGSLKPPSGWETWVMVGSSTGLAYTAGAPPAAGAAPGMFHNIYMQPWAYREFLKNGVFPERTMFVMSFYEPSRKSNPARAGFYEGDRPPGIEVHLKQAGLDKSGWAFFALANDTSNGVKIPGEASCYTCHATEAAHDNVFTQFYPPMRERLAKGAP